MWTPTVATAGCRAPQGAGAKASTPARTGLSERGVATLPAAYGVPATLPGGYSRVATYRQRDVVHLVYSDGLNGLSVFAELGHLSRGSLPSEGTPVQVGRWR